MEMLDLIKADASRDDDDDDEPLDSQELRVLREAGIMPEGKGRRKTGHIVFADNDEEAQQLASRNDLAPSLHRETGEPLPSVGLGWKTPATRKPKKKESVVSESDNHTDHDMNRDDIDEQNQEDKPHRSRTRLLKELSARLVRDTQLRYSQREFEMQRLMMGKGARKKISAMEKVEGDEDDEEDEDEIDARKGRRRKSTRKVDEATYKPRVYKWKLERK